METYLVEKTSDTATIGFKDANLTLITPLMKALEDDENVVLVRYLDEHPELVDRKLMIQVKNGDPMKAFEKAADSLVKYFKS